MVATMKINESPDLAAVLLRLDRLTETVDAIAERQRRSDELQDDLAPILKEMMAAATEKLDVLEKRGAFAVGRELVTLGQRLLDGTSPEDVRRLGDGVAALRRACAGAEPLGLLAMARATRNREVQKGMGVVIELLRHVGRAAEPRRLEGLEGKRARLDAITGRRGVAAAAPRLLPAPAACAAGPSVALAEWTRGLAVELAAGDGVTLSPEHWRLIEFAREDFAANQVSPNIRRITQGLGITTKDVYALFPKAPGRMLARIAGLPKPAGCL